MAPRGLSAADKRIKMLEIFHETAEFFTLKELEKVAPKNKGIVSQSVKEVVDDLVGDGLVTFDKIGTSNCTPSFSQPNSPPSQPTSNLAPPRLDTLTSSTHTGQLMERLLVVSLCRWRNGKLFVPTRPSRARRRKTAGFEADRKKEAALTKSQSELESLTARVAEMSAALKDASKGREDTADRQKLLSQLSSLLQENATLQEELKAFSDADPALYERKKAATLIAKQAALRWTDNSMLLFGYMRGLGASDEELRQQFEMKEGWEDL